MSGIRIIQNLLIGIIYAINMEFISRMRPISKAMNIIMAKSLFLMFLNGKMPM